MKRFAAIDMGTNSFHMVIVRADQDGNFEIMEKVKRTVRLGSGGGDLNLITDDAIERGIAALDEFVKIAKAHGASVRAVATSAVREARNRQDFLKKVKKATGLKVDVIRGQEEARLIYLGVLQAMPVYQDTVFLMDIGGGSTEYLVGRQSEPLYATSLKLGAIRLTDRFFPEGKVTEDALSLCRTYLQVKLNHLKSEMPDAGFDHVIGCSGTIRTILEIAQKHGKEATNDTFTKNDLDTAAELLLKAKNTDERMKLSGLDDKRADIITGGVVLLQESFRVLKLDKMRVSPFALREGVVYDSIVRKFKKSKLEEIRKSTVIRLAKSLLPDGPAQRCADLCIQIHAGLQTAGLILLKNDSPDLLIYAAMLHNIGVAIGHSAHHKHSRYIIRNAEVLMGFTRIEVEIIAAIARYHRKALPSKKHDEYKQLSKSDRKLVKLYAGILRVAIGLSRGESGRVQEIRTLYDGSSFTIFCIASAKYTADNLQLETEGAQLRLPLLSRELDMPVHIRALRPEDISSP